MRCVLRQLGQLYSGSIAVVAAGGHLTRHMLHARSSSCSKICLALDPSMLMRLPRVVIRRKRRRGPQLTQRLCERGNLNWRKALLLERVRCGPESQPITVCAADRIFSVICNFHACERC